MTVVDSRKDVVARIDSQLSADRFSMPDLLDSAFETKKPVISTELLSREVVEKEVGTSRLPLQLVKNKVMAVMVVVPVLAPNGDILGAVVAGDILNDDQFLSEWSHTLFGEDSQVSISQEETVIVSSDRSEVVNSARIDPEIILRLKAGKSFSGLINGTVPLRGSFQPVIDGHGNFIGSLSVARNLESFRKIRRESVENILTAAAAAMAVSLIIAFFVFRRLAEPLSRLARGVRMIEAGYLNQQVEVSSEDEVGQLARYFNSMARTLAERNSTIQTKTMALEQLNEQLEAKVKERTSQLQLEMGMLEAVLICMVEGIVVTDSELRIIQFNPAAQKIFDVVPHRVLGKTVAQLEQKEGFAELAKLVLGANAADSHDQGETTLHVKGKKLQALASPLLDGKGASLGVVVSLRDVTGEEEVDRMKTDFISTVSHELKTPLTSIKGALQFIVNKGKWLTSTERELITVCQRNTDRLSKLISDILDISKIEAGGVEFNFEPQNVAQIVMTAIEEVRGMALAKGITIVNCTHKDLPMLYGDLDRLVQVLTNLLSNAAKFSPEQKTVMVNAEHTGNYVTISVSDSGRTIQWTDRHKLFRKFQQLERDDMGSSGGTGLGLAICKEIVERHHGRIYYETGPAGGNVFSFAVPVYEESHAERNHTDS
jgi:PAS domain S-box-containing protein